ncbi:hypothetical protein [Montanilutibacter psychrotolerans]|uniref:Uncharacterized protein n=1 Tax=Montanilutibacter psychrotolerans TaxID=1327343 RepID=A0A3M8SN93_9GAMM|nr:hypothetical protein [Lysobacter psychrotolerans]RNF82273.1 hypothetical protein EER27_15290 [Lysobacter psychrotolerans]
MNVDLQLTSLDTNPASPNYSGDAYIRLLEDSQGNILKSHGRDFGAQFAPSFLSAALSADGYRATWGVRRDGSVAFDFSTWVQMRGGEYFYLPSLGFFRSL